MDMNTSIDTNKRNEITYDEIFEKIDDAFDLKKNIVFVCNYEMADEIINYIGEVYDLFDRESDLYEDDIDEYFVSVYFDEDENEIRVYCENIRGENGVFKINDVSMVIDYYIFLEMDVEEISEYLKGDEGSTWGLYDLVEEDDDDDDDDDDFIDYEEDEEYKILEGFADRIMSLNDNLCPNCVMNIVCDLYEAGKKAALNEAFQPV